MNFTICGIVMCRWLDESISKTATPVGSLWTGYLFKIVLSEKRASGLGVVKVNWYIWGTKKGLCNRKATVIWFTFILVLIDRCQNKQCVAFLCTEAYKLAGYWCTYPTPVHNWMHKRGHYLSISCGEFSFLSTFRSFNRPSFRQKTTWDYF